MVENGTSGMSIIWWIIIILAIIFLVWMFIKSARSKGSSNFMVKEAELEILEGRFRNGEIDEAEYKKEKDELTGKKPHR